MNGGLSAADLWGLFSHFLMLSLLSVGGAIATVPDMHRYIVNEQHWITSAQFASSIAIAQAAPGPNVLFVAVLGWNIAGPIGTLATTVGVLLPSTVLSLWANRWGTRHRESRGVRAFTAGLMPVTLGLLLATGWVLAAPHLQDSAHRETTLGLIALTWIVMANTRLNPVWLIAAGAAAGGLGWV